MASSVGKRGDGAGTPSAYKDGAGNQADSVHLLAGPTGAPNSNPFIKAISSAQSGNGTQIVGANPLRRTITIKNIDTALTIWAGNAGVVSATADGNVCFQLLKGESISVDTTAAIFGRAASGAPLVTGWETYD